MDHFRPNRQPPGFYRREEQMRTVYLRRTIATKEQVMTFRPAGHIVCTPPGSLEPEPAK